MAAKLTKALKHTWYAGKPVVGFLLLSLATLLVLSVVALRDAPGRVCTDSPEVWDEMQRIAFSGGNTDAGAPYVWGGGTWDPWNWSGTGPDCTGYVGKIWQLRVREPTNFSHDLNTASLVSRCTPNPTSWYYVSRSQFSSGDSLSWDPDCWDTGAGHARLYGWGNTYTGAFAVFEATDADPFHRVVHRSIYWEDGYEGARRAVQGEPGLVGREDANSWDGNFYQPIVDAYNRDGGRGVVGTVRYNGGGFLVHNWGNGKIQDFEGGSGGAGGLMRPNSRTSRAYWVHGAIWSTYVNMGGAGSWLKYPLSDEYPWHSNCGEWAGVPVTNFEEGYITLDCGTGTWRAYSYGWLQNSSFEGGSVAYWNRLTQGSNWVVYSNPPTPPGGGTWWLEFNPGYYQTSTSIYQDVPRPVKPGDTLNASVWVRCPWGGGGCLYQFGVWGLEQDQEEMFGTQW